MTTYAITLGPGQQTELTVEALGGGQPFLLLHGGAGTQSMAGLAQRLSADGQAQVYLPTHPGFGGTARPDWLDGIGGLADTYVALLEQLDQRDVTVIGSSIGGWIAAEMATRRSPRTGRFILIDAVGIEVAGQAVVDIFPLPLPELARLSYYNPAAFRIDPTTMTDAQKQVMAGNRQALAVYGGQPPKVDPTLRARLGAVNKPTLVLWGDSDGIVTPDYGRAFAAAIPGARFQLLPKAGHLPQMETPDQTVAAIGEFVKG